jgi:hypothetical protein
LANGQVALMVETPDPRNVVVLQLLLLVGQVGLSNLHRCGAAECRDCIVYQRVSDCGSLKHAITRLTLAHSSPMPDTTP